MTLTELTNEVYSITNRPDLVNDTAVAIRAATLKAHQSDYYFKDLYEVGIIFDTSAFVQNLDYRSIIPLWKSLKYLRKYDLTSGVPGKELTIILPEMIFDEYGIQKVDVCYGAGAFIQINSCTQEQAYLLGCYLNPNITPTGYNSWVALDNPYAIVFDACGTVFKGIGKDDEATTYRALVSEQISMLRTSNILVNGF